MREVQHNEKLVATRLLESLAHNISDFSILMQPENDNFRDAAWNFLVNSTLTKIDELTIATLNSIHALSGAQAVAFLRCLDKLLQLPEIDLQVMRELKNEAIKKFKPKTREDKLAWFLFLSKPENREEYKKSTWSGLISAEYLNLEREIAENIEDYPKSCRKYFFEAIAKKEIDKNTFVLFNTKPPEVQMELLACLAQPENAKHNQDKRYGFAEKTSKRVMKLLVADNNQPEKVKVTQLLKDKLATYDNKIKSQNLGFFSEQRRAVRRLEFATSNSSFFKPLRKKILKDVLQSRDKRTAEIVAQVLTAPAA